MRNLPDRQHCFMRSTIFKLLFILPLSLIGDDQLTQVEFSDATISKDQDGRIFLTINSPENIAGLQFTLAFDSTKLMLGKPEFSPENKHLQLHTGGDSDEVKVIAFSMDGKGIDLTNPVLTIPISSLVENGGELELIVKDFIASSPRGKKINLRISSGQIFIVPELPKKFKLSQNFPNPFEAETEIKFELAEDAIINLSVFDSSGDEVRILKNNVLPAGYHSISWDGKNASGEEMSSGEYICLLKVGVNHHSMKMVLLR
tara:strand:- start:2534 stop:3310 length:777 start_codon:yes stop_codon:yes gene_type:complete